MWFGAGIIYLSYIKLVNLLVCPAFFLQYVRKYWPYLDGTLKMCWELSPISYIWIWFISIEPWFNTTQYWSCPSLLSAKTEMHTVLTGWSPGSWLFVLLECVNGNRIFGFLKEVKKCLYSIFWSPFLSYKKRNFVTGVCRKKKQKTKKKPLH